MGIRDIMFLLIGLAIASFIWVAVIIMILRYLDKPLDDEFLMKRNWPVK